VAAVNEAELSGSARSAHRGGVIIAGTIAPIEASQLRNLGGVASASADAAPMRVVASVPGVGAVELDANGHPTPATLARAKAVAARLLADPSVFRVAPEASALLGPGVLDMAALAAVVASLGECP